MQAPGGRPLRVLPSLSLVLRHALGGFLACTGHQSLGHLPQLDRDGLALARARDFDLDGGTDLAVSDRHDEVVRRFHGLAIQGQDDVALAQARQQVPPGATVTREVCSEIEVGMSPRYRCSVEWQPAAAASEANPDPANGTAPGR